MKYDIERLRRETVELLSKIEREELAAREEARVRTAVEEALIAHEKNRPAPEPKRSEMTPYAKSRYIRAHGSARYLALPFK